MPVVKLKLRVNEAGHGQLFVDDLDISDSVIGVEFIAKVGELTKVNLTITADVDAEIEARLDQFALAKAARDQPPQRPVFVPLKAPRVSP